MSTIMASERRPAPLASAAEYSAELGSPFESRDLIGMALARPPACPGRTPVSCSSEKTPRSDVSSSVNGASEGVTQRHPRFPLQFLPRGRAPESHVGQRARETKAGRSQPAVAEEGKRIDAKHQRPHNDVGDEDRLDGPLGDF